MTRPCVLALVLLLGTTTASRADEPQPAERPPTAPIRVYVDFGPFAASAPWWYEVRKDDTLSEVAARWLGSARRHAEVPRLNPGLDPQRLRPGTRLLLPPRQPPAPTDDPPRIDLLAAPYAAQGTPEDVAGRGLGALEWVVPGESLARSASGGSVLVAVRHERLEELEQALSARRGVLEALYDLAGRGVVVLSAPVGGEVPVPPDHPVPFVVHQVRLQAIAGPTLAVEVRPLATAAAPTPPADGPPGWALVLVLVLVLVAAGLALRRTARRA